MSFPGLCASAVTFVVMLYEHRCSEVDHATFIGWVSSRTPICFTPRPPAPPPPPPRQEHITSIRTLVTFSSNARYVFFECSLRFILTFSSWSRPSQRRDIFGAYASATLNSSHCAGQPPRLPEPATGTPGFYRRRQFNGTCFD